MTWPDLLRRTWAEDILACPRCRGRMAVLEPVTDPADIREHLARLGLAAVPATFAPPRDPDDEPARVPPHRAGRGPPSSLPPDAAPTDDGADPPWQEDCQLPLYDDASHVPPDAHD